MMGANNPAGKRGTAVARPNYRRLQAAVKLVMLALIIIGLATPSGLGTLCAAGIGAIAAACPLGALESVLASRTGVPIALISLAVMLALAALLGRAFCAWICPVPPIQRFFHPNSKASKSGNSAEGDIAGREAEGGAMVKDPLADRITGGNWVEECIAEGDAHGNAAEAGATQSANGIRYGILGRLDSRHAVLAGALASSAVFGFPVFCLVCPVGLSFATVVALWRAFAEHDPTWSLLVFPVILVLELVIFRKWCGTLCPLGALLSLVGAKAPIGKPQVDSKACLRMNGANCNACTQTCPERLDPHASELAQCTRCGDCAHVCPAHAISLRLRG